ncbi:MAG: DUF2235 domain-containing protein [Pseudomonadota bacterium]
MGQRSVRQPRNLIFISDGTLSSDELGARSNAGRLAALLDELGPSARQSVLYDRGIQGSGMMRWVNAATGAGIERSIRDGYAFLASRYRPGDRIYLFGYSRGAYAVRSLAGMIGRVGLLRAERATERHVRVAFRHYTSVPPRPTLRGFREAHCHTHVPIEMLGVWDTVRALGLPWPGLSWLAPMAVSFHDAALAHHIRHGYQALALDETRLAYRPRRWRRSPGWQGRLEQTWFPGCHGDVGGEVRHFQAARGLANIPLNWMLRRASSHGVDLPDDWVQRFPEDPAAPSSADRTWLAPLFVLRVPRRTGGGDGETMHLSVQARMAALPRYRPAARATVPGETLTAAATNPA